MLLCQDKVNHSWLMILWEGKITQRTAHQSQAETCFFHPSSSIQYANLIVMVPGGCFYFVFFSSVSCATGMFTTCVSD